MGGVLSAIAAGPTPIKIDPTLALQRRIQLGDLQAQQMERQAQAQDLQVKTQLQQRTQQNQFNLSAAFRDADGDPEQTVNLARNRGVDASFLQQYQEAHEKMVQTRMANSETENKLAVQHHDQARAGLETIAQLPEDQRPEAYQGWLNSDAKQVLPPKEWQTLAQLHPEYKGAGPLAMLSATFNTGSKVAEEANNRKKAQAESDQAAARLMNAKTTAAEVQAKIPGIAADTAQKQRVQDAQDLAAVARQGPDAVQAAIDQMPHGRAKSFVGLTKPEQFMQAALTPEQAATQSNAAAGHAETARHNVVDERTASQRLAIEGSRLNLEREKSGFDMNGGVSPAAKGIANGDFDPLTVRSMLRRSPGLLNQVKQVDANFDEANIEKRYNTLKEFTSTSNTKAGGQVLALNTLIHHADLYQQTADAMNNGSFRPGNAAYNAVSSMMGSPAPNNAALVARFLAGETGKVATGGVPAEGEIKGILSNLGSNGSPQQMRQAGDKLLEIAAGRATPLIEKVNDAKLGGVVKVIGPDAQKILQSRGFDPTTMKRSGNQIPQGNGRTVDAGTIKQFIDANGGDKEKTRKMLTDNGWVIPKVP